MSGSFIGAWAVVSHVFIVSQPRHRRGGRDGFIGVHLVKVVSR